MQILLKDCDGLLAVMSVADVEIGLRKDSSCNLYFDDIYDNGGYAVIKGLSVEKAEFYAHKIFTEGRLDLSDLNVKVYESEEDDEDYAL